MAKLFKELARRTILSGYQNLVALDDPYLAMERLLKGRTVTGILDAGASNGHVSKKLLRYFPRATAYAFEPNPEYEEDLRQVSAEDPRVMPQAYALSDRIGTMELHVAQSRGVTSLFKPGKRLQQLHPEKAQITEVKQVPVTTIDEWARQNGNPALELLKFDIQAAELLAMRGAAETLETSTLLVYTEIFFNPMYEGGAIYSEIDLFLRSKGFSLFNMYKTRADSNGMLDQGNAIFVRTDKLGLTLSG